MNASETTADRDPAPETESGAGSRQSANIAVMGTALDRNEIRTEQGFEVRVLRSRDVELIRRLAAEYHVGLADSLATFQNLVHSGGKLSELMAQVHHPNRQGHELVAAELLKWFPVSN